MTRLVPAPRGQRAIVLAVAFCVLGSHQRAEPQNPLQQTGTQQATPAPQSSPAALATPSVPAPTTVVRQPLPALKQAPKDGSTIDQQTPVPPPVGTAAAPDMRPEGTPASAPAGAAIAPAKQRRVKSFSVRVALLVGAAVAVGIVAGAALGSSSSSH